MALIKCSECGTEVSDRADKCPKCACPIGTSFDPKTQVIEQTSKKLKLQLVIGAIIILASFPAGYVFESAGISIFLLVIGLIVIVVTKISIWWRHH